MNLYVQLLNITHKHEAELFQPETSENSSIFSALVPNIEVLHHFLLSAKQNPSPGLSESNGHGFLQGCSHRGRLFAVTNCSKAISKFYHSQ